MPNNYVKVLTLVIVFRITECETDCKPSARGEDYRGYTSRTNTGKTCQLWNVHVPHAHNMGPRLPGGATANVNYCRNPDSWNHPSGPWCYTTWANVTWEYCALPLCPNPQPVASWIFDTDHGGADNSFLKENPVTMANLTFRPGYNGQTYGAVILPAKQSQRMVVTNPTSALRLKHTLSFITYVYVVGSPGLIMSYNNWNGDDTVRLSIYIDKDSTTLTTSLYYHQYLSATVYDKALNVLSEGWSKIGISITASEVRTYINGSLVHQSPSTRRDLILGGYTSDGAIFFGSVPGKDNRTVGRMACAKFYDLALNATQMANVDCMNKACKEILSGRCAGSCLGFSIGEQCNIYIYPLLVQQTTITTNVLNTKAIEVSWDISQMPTLATRQYYRFIVRHTEKDLFEFKHSNAIKIGADATDSHTFSYTIENLDRDVEYEISIRSEREVGDSKDHQDSGIVTARIPCIAPETPRGLYIEKTNDTFVVTWTSILEELRGGCSSKQMYLYYKLMLSDYWNIQRIGLTIRNYTFPAEGHSDCFVKMIVVNNAELESSTVVYILGNVTLPPPTPSSGYTGPPGDGQSSPTTESSVDGGILDQHTREELSQITLILAVCLAVVGVVMIAGVILAAVCWKKNIKLEKDLKSKTSQQDDPNVSRATHQDAKRKTEYAPYLEPVASSDDTYHEIASRSGPGTENSRQYESLDTEN